MRQLMEREQMHTHVQEGLIFLKWVLYACSIGLLVGAVAIAFHYGIDWAAELRGEYPRVVWLLPAGGVSIVLLYRICGMERDRGTNLVLVAVREAEPLKLRTAPLIFLSTIITHLVGGSAGREGAALQLGGSLAAFVGRKIRLDAKDSRMMVMCGMAAAFSALFGTPLTAAIFAMEVVSVGVMYYAAMVPCVTAALVSFQLAKLCGLHMEDGYDITQVAELSPVSMVQTAALGLLCALVSILFCKVMHAAPHLYQKYFPGTLLRVTVGALLVLALTVAVGNQDYNGAGDAVIRRMLAGETIPEAFLLKILFTALTLGAGFRGGEIVPVLFTGCAFGTLVGPLLGLPHSFSGALGMAAVFCGATNCLLSSLMLAFELFGGGGLPLYALCCGVSYMLSGYYGLYSEQKIVYSKFKTEWIDKKAK
ncbi:chloride channel protein [Flavonifractor sp. An100]|uniref:chloride channel protein n=1 Tax=Flavonifractor sp. An100 TaxID=1965538 RepID=UPI001FA8DC15|nr:chloride channel protein [Flavonifractor sp. An100]